MRKVAAVLVTVVLSSAGCGSGTDLANPSAGENAKPPAGYTETTIEDCEGHRSTYDRPPERVVALNTAVLEMLFWLGVEDRIVGSGLPPKPGTFPDRFESELRKLPRLAGGYVPGSYQPVPREQLLAADPDFVIGGFASNFQADGAASQEELADSGVASYLAVSTACDAAVSTPRTGFELVYQDLRNLGAIFGVRGRAKTLIAEMRSKLDGVGERIDGVRKPTVFPFEFDEGTQTPYAPGNRQAINAVLGSAGARNLFGDLDDAYQKVSWEQVAQRNPDAILLVVYDNGSDAENAKRFAEAERFVESFAPLTGTTAVRDGRYARLLYEQGSNGGVRNADAVVELAKQLHPGPF